MDGQSEPERVIEVVRDNTFVRFIADEAVVFDLGRDLEVGFLQYGPIVTTQTDLGSAERTDVTNVVTEVARMRMGQSEFLSTAMRFLKAGIEDGRLNGVAISQSIQGWAASSVDKTNDDEGGGR